MSPPRIIPPNPRDNRPPRSPTSASSSSKLLSSPTAGETTDDTASSTATSVYSSVVSVSSSYRHSVPTHQLHEELHPPSPPQPTLVHDASRKPKTTGTVGLLVVGISGRKGTCLLAGLLANRLGLSWRGPQGQARTSTGYPGCLTQQLSNGVGGGGYRDRVKGLADANLAAIGGWDIRPNKPGDALLEAQLLDYDLVRQLHEEMNKVKVFRGVFHPHFGDLVVPPSHILSKQEAPTDSEALKCLRADIRYFKWRNGVVGHTTVIWAPSRGDCPDIELRYQTADDLLQAIELSEQERGGPLPPSILYATAALLEGCSFLDGGDGDATACPGLQDLARQQTGVYCLGSGWNDEPRRQFRSVAAEYLTAMGYQPRQQQQSIHEEGDDEEEETVGIMATSDSADSSPHSVTAYGFLGQPLTVTSFTSQPRQCKAVFTVPLLLDGATWCDYFSSRSWPYDKVARALSYLFSRPYSVPPNTSGLFRQLQELHSQVMAAHIAKQQGGLKRENSVKKKKVRIRPDNDSATVATEWAIPHEARIICAGLACVDMQLHQASSSGNAESIETFQGERSIGGGSVSMACKTLARLCHGAPLDEEVYMQVTPPVVHSVIPLCKIGKDATGDKLIQLLQDCGAASRNVEIKYSRMAREKPENASDRTALAVLPIYQDGRRGCFFDAASNATFSARDMTNLIQSLSLSASAISTNMTNHDMELYHADLEQMTPIYGAFLFGYPHLLPLLQGESLAQVLLEARSCMIEGGIIGLDLNGVPEQQGFDVENASTAMLLPTASGDSEESDQRPRRMILPSPRDADADEPQLRSVASLKSDPVIGAALEHVDILHMNQDELCLLTGCEFLGTPEGELQDEYTMACAVNLFLLCGVAIVVVTRGSKGCFVSCNDATRFRRAKLLPSSWVDCTARIPAVQLPASTVINTNGAGDSFTAGFLVATMLRHTGMTVPPSTKSTATITPRGGESLLINRSFSGEDYSVDSSTASSPAATESVASTSSRTTSTSTTTRTATSRATNNSKLTPYTLYMRENYMTLKKQCNNDKKAIFSMCHEKWENESEEVKSFYQRKVQLQLEEQAAAGARSSPPIAQGGSSQQQPESSSAPEEQGQETNKKRARPSPLSIPTTTNATTPTTAAAAVHTPASSSIGASSTTSSMMIPRNLYMTNRSLNLESAIQFAGLVAAHHIDMNKRNLDHLDVSELLEAALIFPSGLEEI